MSNSNTYVDQKYYKMYGLGTAIAGIGAGRTTDYKGNNVGGALQYGYNGCINLLFESSYNYKVEDAKISFTSPYDEGTTRDSRWEQSLRLQKESGNYINSFQLNYLVRRIDGIQYITAYNSNTENPGYVTLSSNVRSKYKTNSLGADYTLMKKRVSDYAWRLNASALYSSQKDEYLLPYSDKKSENVKFNLGGKANLNLSNKLNKRLLLGADVCYNKNLSGEYNYNGPHADYPVVTKFETTDLNYLITNYYGFNVSAVYSQRVKADLKADAYAKVDVNYTKAKDFDFGHRSVLEVSVGCNF